MRPRRSLSGPLVLIGVGALFLAHTISPDIQIWEFVARYWPYLLIIWGAVQLVEIALWSLRDGRGPYEGLGGGAWALVLFICLVGSTMFELDRPGTWWHDMTFGGGLEVFGDERTYEIAAIEKATGATPHIVIESFRGGAKISAGGDNTIRIGGHKSIRAVDVPAANRANEQTPIDVIVQDKTIVIRCNQSRASSKSLVATDLDITAPAGSSIEITGTNGDMDVSGLQGDVDLSSDNAGIHVANVHGNVHIDTRKSSMIECESIGGAVVLRGKGQDLTLSKIGGDVNIDGDYSGVVSLADVAKQVRVGTMRTEFTSQSISGEVKLARGSLDAHGLTGPVKITTQNTDVALADFTNDLDLSVDRGDINLQPGHALSKMTVRTGSGDIDVRLPAAANFAITATADHGSIDSNLGSGFSAHDDGHEAHLTGSNGDGPQLDLTTGRGDISLHKDGAQDSGKRAQAQIAGSAI